MLGKDQKGKCGLGRLLGSYFSILLRDDYGLDTGGNEEGGEKMLDVGSFLEEFLEIIFIWAIVVNIIK